MDVGILAAVDAIEDPGRERRAEIPVQGRHGSLLDGAAKAAPHNKLGARTELRDKWGQLPEVIGQIRVSHDNPASPDVRERVDVGPAQPPLWYPQYFAA